MVFTIRKENIVSAQAKSMNIESADTRING